PCFRSAWAPVGAHIQVHPRRRPYSRAPVEERPVVLPPARLWSSTMVHLLDFRPLELEPLSELRQRADEACKRARELRHQIQDALDSARDSSTAPPSAKTSRSSPPNVAKGIPIASLPPLGCGLRGTPNLPTGSKPI